MKTQVLIDHEPVADGGFLVRALLRLEGEPATHEGRIPLNLSLVIDRSGSMHGPPLRAALDAVCGLVRRLRADDVVSVVAYDREVVVVAPPATGPEQSDLPLAVAALRSGGSTNLSGGWLRGRELVAEGLRPGGVNRVLLLTDGRANAGITDPDTLVGLCAQARQLGITTTTLGFGPHYDEDLLRAMADAGGGGTHHIGGVDDAPAVFDEEIEGLASICAQNVRVRIRPGADADAMHVVHDYPSHSTGNVLSVEVGDVYAREPRRVLVECLLKPGDEADAEAEVAEITVTALVLTPAGDVELRTITLPLTLDPQEGGRVEPEVRREVLLLAAARAREAALRAEERGDHEGRRAVLRDAITRLSASADTDATLADEVRDLELMERTFAQGTLQDADIKYLKQRSYDTHRSRGSSKRRTGRRTREE